MMKVVFFIVLLQLALVSWKDLRDAKISNYWALVNILLGGICYVAFPDLYVIGWSVLVAPLLTLIGGFILFNLNIMGAGDSKYLASLFLVTPVDLHLDFFQKLVLGTLAVGSILLARRLFTQFRELRVHLLTLHWAGLMSSLQSRFSYAPVMLLAWVSLALGRWR